MSAPKAIVELVARFGEQLDSYKSGKYNETQVRVEYIDPLFKALGWDIHNEQGLAPAYQDVIHEDAIKIGFDTKAPDYCFRVGGTRKFFLEAKKPAVNIKEDVGPAFQVRRYAWSSKLPLSILTDFEEFAVYDCRIKPQKGDKPSVGRVFYCRFEEYEHKWNEIAGVFSKEAVLKGSFDKFAESNKKKKGTTEVDDAFLEEIESWREVLAKNIALRNSKLSVRGLNYSVQQTIDRIIFLRICEDRGIEPYGRLRDLIKGASTYKRLVDLYRNADDRYNSGLFHFREESGRTAEPDTLTLSLKIDDDVLKGIFRDLYYPDSPYEFSVLPADILGQVYEQFLGKVIRLTTAHKAKVEEKPEVRKAGGVYYTPRYIVDYIIKNTLGKLLDEKTPKEVAEIRVLDPACGSGSFLIQAYQYLLDWHCEWYSKNDPEKYSKGRMPKVYRAHSGVWRLTTQERKRILLNSIYGVDIDNQATEVTKLSLLLKVLEGESDQSVNQTRSLFHERALPDLQDNIKCGNSLIESDFYQGEQIDMLGNEQGHKVNPFDWRTQYKDIFGDGGFDCVISNPPYIDSEWMTEYMPESREYCTAHYKSARGNWDIFCVFIERALQLCADHGIAGMIVPNKLGSAVYGEGVRKVIDSEATLLGIADYSKVPVFPVAVYPIVWTATKQKHKGDYLINYERYIKSDSSMPVVGLQKQLSYQEYFYPPEQTWRIFDDLDASGLIKRIERGSRPLGEIARVLGAATVSEAYELQELISESARSDARLLRVTNSGTIDRYISLWGVDPIRYLGDKYLRPIISRENEQRLPPKRRDQARTPKIIIAGMTKHLECFLDSQGQYLAGKSTTIVMAENNLAILTAILNSKLIDYYYHVAFGGQKMQGGYLRVGPPQIGTIPIRNVETREGGRGRILEEIERLAGQRYQMGNQIHQENTPHEKQVLSTRIEFIDNRLDDLIFELYELSSEDITVVRNALSAH